MNQIYINIKNRRQELKMSQDTLAKLCGYSDRSMITKIEKGKVNLSYDKIYVFAKALKVEPEDLMGWEGTTDAELTPANAAMLAEILHDATLVEQIKKILVLDEKKKETLYNYIDFLSSN